MRNQGQVKTNYNYLATWDKRMPLFIPHTFRDLRYQDLKQKKKQSSFLTAFDPNRLIEGNVGVANG